MAYNPQRSTQNNMNMTGTQFNKQNDGNKNLTGTAYNNQTDANIANSLIGQQMNLTGTIQNKQIGSNIGSSSFAGPMAQSINSPPQKVANVSPIREQRQVNALNSSKGYHQFVDDEVLGVINKAAEPPSTLLSTTDLISAVVYLVWGIIFLVSHYPQDIAKCPTLRATGKNVGFYCLALAVIKGLGLFAQHTQKTNDVEKQKIRFVMRIGRAIEMFLLLCATVCLSMASASICDTDCGKLQIITTVFLILSWVFMITLAGLYSVFMYRQFQQQYQIQPFSSNV